MSTILREPPMTAAPMQAPRLGFLGVGWIGRNRMEAIAHSGAGRIAAVADLSAASVEEARGVADAAVAADSLDALLALELDGIVIATPSGLHAEQAVRALEHGVPVFCQKPLGRTAAETERVIAAARAADLLLGVDLSYRCTTAMRALRSVVAAGEIGTVYAADLTFHNAYAPGQSWCYDAQLAGGGCVIDLGIHLVDLALWTLGFPQVADVSSHLYHRGGPLGAGEVEDYAVATITLANGAVLRMACSWNLHAGRDAVIEVTFRGTDGAASFRNVNGSFHDFRADLYTGAHCKQLIAPPDAWGGRAAVEWVRRVARGDGYDAAVEQLVHVAATLDRMRPS